MTKNEKKKIFLMRPNVGEQELELVRQVLSSKYLVEGPMTREFERTVADYVGVKHGIACTSCTVGLELSLKVLGVGPGDEVIVPDFTHPATALVVLTVGAEPVLVDVDMNTCNVDAEKIEGAITDRTKVAIPVSLFGRPLDIDPINELRDKHGIHIIEDAACSLGSEIDGGKVGSLTDITVFSFHPRKIFTTGDGGLLTTDNDEWAEKINSIKRFGIAVINGETQFVRWGTNYRLSNILGAVALGQVRRIKEIIDDRIEKARIYDELLENLKWVRILHVKPNVKWNYQTYVVFIEKESLGNKKIVEKMRKKEIEVQIGTYALHLQPFFKNTRRIGSLSNSSKLYENLLALPLHHELTYEDQKKIVEELEDTLRNM